MILAISCCKEPLSESEFVEPLVELAGKAKVSHWSKVGDSDVERAEKIIISGTALQDFDYLEGDWSWLKSCKVPVLGICAGAQVIAKAFGAELVKKVAIGVQPIKVVKENPLLREDASGYFLYSLAPRGQFDVLAESDGVPCLLQVCQKLIFLSTFHPEVMTDAIIRNFLSQKL